MWKSTAKLVEISLYKWTQNIRIGLNKKSQTKKEKEIARQTEKI